MNINVDLKNVREFVTSDTFTSFLTSKTTDFGIAAFILQTVLDKLDDIKKPKDGAKYYKIREDELLDLLEDAAKMAVLRADGVDNWWGYMEGRVECFKEWYDVSDEEAYGMSFEDAAKLDITQYEGICEQDV